MRNWTIFERKTLFRKPLRSFWRQNVEHFVRQNFCSSTNYFLSGALLLLAPPLAFGSVTIWCTNPTRNPSRNLAYLKSKIEILKFKIKILREEDDTFERISRIKIYFNEIMFVFFFLNSAITHRCNNGSTGAPFLVLYCFVPNKRGCCFRCPTVCCFWLNRSINSVKPKY